MLLKLTIIDIKSNTLACNHASLDVGATEGQGSQFRTTARLFGNITTGGINPTVSFLEHYITDSTGAQILDQKVISKKDIAIDFTFDEINTHNLTLFLSGTDRSASAKAATPVFTPMSAALQYGSAQLHFRTDVGNPWVYMIPKCTIRSNGNMTLGADSWWTGPMVLEILANDWYPTSIATPASSINANYGIISMK